MKRKIAIALLAAVVFAIALVSCSRSEREDGKIKIVVTILPEYDWVLNVLGDEKERFETTLLLGNGGDFHSYQPSVADMAKIVTCDLFVFVGGESDGWVKDALKNSTNKSMKAISLLETLGDCARKEEFVEGMEEEADADEQEHESVAELDEHVWMSLRKACVFVAAISDSLQTIDPVNSEKYAKNASEYVLKLRTLDDEYVRFFDSTENKTLIVADRFPFRYFADDYSLSYYAAFPGCSSETQASFKTIAFLVRKAEELSMPSIFAVDGSDGKIARTVRDSTKSKDQKIFVLDSMQSVSLKEYEEGRTYLSVMASNLSVLKEAFR
ncbi:MAG TPA: zinc ABC transporter substrate-binding protein [Spirochaetaceae bacterium]|nr:zinc ABC transporter substrate-binding protein [Spirochaetaceae bacterium]